MPIPPVLILVGIVVLYLISSVKILAEYQRGVIFRLGKLLPQPKGPGVILVFAPIDRIVRVSLRTVAFEVPPQDVITRDNVSVKVSAVLYYRVVDPRRAIVEVENYQYATLQLAHTTLRSVLGQAQLDDLLAERDRLNQQLQHILDEHAEPWGSKCRPSRSSMSICRPTCSDRWPGKPKPNGRNGRKSSTPKASWTRRPSWRRPLA
jgi:regulator of protease activity HflC (stomatin/prohibitin superfamily)